MMRMKYKIAKGAKTSAALTWGRREIKQKTHKDTPRDKKTEENIYGIKQEQTNKEPFEQL